MKTRNLLFLCFLLSVNLSGQQKSYELSTPDNVSKTYIARDYIRLLPGYSFNATGGSTLYLGIDEHLSTTASYQNLSQIPNPNRGINTGYAVGTIAGDTSASPTGATLIWDRGSNETKIQINSKYWWYRISKEELMLSQAPVGEGSYFFEKLNLSEIQQDSITENGVCTKCENKTILTVLENEPAYIKESCYNVFGKEYSFVIVLVNRPDIEYYFSKTIYSCEGVPEEFQVNGLPVLIGGYILDCKHIVICGILSPNARYASFNLFELKTIKKR